VKWASPLSCSSLVLEMIERSKVLSFEPNMRWLAGAFVLAASIELGKQVATGDFRLVVLLAILSIGTLLLVRPQFRLWFCLAIWWGSVLIHDTEMPNGIVVGPGEIEYAEIAMVGILVVAIAHVLRSRDWAFGNALALPPTSLITWFVGGSFLLLFVAASINSLFMVSRGFAQGPRLLLPALVAFSLLPIIRQWDDFVRAINVIHIAALLYVLYAMVAFSLIPLPLYHGRAGALVSLGSLLTLERVLYYGRTENHLKRNVYCLALLPFISYLFLVSNMWTDRLLCIVGVWLFLIMQEFRHSRNWGFKRLFLTLAGAGGILATTVVFVATVQPILTRSYHPADWLVELLALAGETWFNVSDRYMRWRVIFKIIAANPFRLCFINFSYLYYTNLYGDVHHVAPHNIFVQAAASMTIFAPFLVIFLLLRFYKFGFQTAAKLPGDFSGRVLALTSLVAGAFFADTMADKFLNYQYSLIVWLAIMLVMAASVLGSPRTKPNVGNRT